MATAQFFHHRFFIGSSESLYSEAYAITLIGCITGFYFFSLGVLQVHLWWASVLILHVTLIGLLIIVPADIMVPVIFLLGSFYAGVYTFIIVRARQHSKRRPLEFFMFTGFVVMALSLSMLGFFQANVSPLLFPSAYSIFVSITLVATFYILLKYPSLATDTAELIKSSYAKSTLTGVDTAKLEMELNGLLINKKCYVDQDVSLMSLAKELNITTHQLSEYTNTHFGYGFSQLLRIRRVQEAKKLLIDEPKTAVLAIGLSVGFASQSNFYSAFREQETCTPGQFRKKHLRQCAST